MKSPRSRQTSRARTTGSKTAPNKHQDFKGRQKAASTGPGTTSAQGTAETQMGASPFPSSDSKAQVPQGLLDSLSRQGAGVEEMAHRMNKFQGNWNTIPQAADDDNALS